jgi:predicted thioesterase
LSEQDIQEYYSFLTKVSPDGKTSMLQDVEAKRKTEVEIFAGKVMELASRSAIDGLLPGDKMTVGTQISIRHFGAVPLGARVKAESILTEISGRRLLFDVIAYDNFEKIAEGRNEQLIVSVEGFLKKVRWKKGVRE